MFCNFLLKTAYATHHLNGKIVRGIGEKSDRIAGINNRSDCREHALPRIIQCCDVFRIQPGVNKVNDRLLFRVKHSDLIYIV